MTVVDLHAHLGVPAADALVRAAGIASVAMPFSEPATDAVNGAMFAAIGPKLCGTAVRIEDMDAAGIDIQVMSPNPAQYYYAIDAEIARAASQVVNDGIANAVAAHPDRLLGMGTLPMQAPELAVAEMRRCVRDLGLRGIEIGTWIAGRELSDPLFAPVFSAAEELGVPLFIHPLGFSHGERLSRYYLNNIIGNPLESAIALSHLILGGTLDRHAALKLCVAHGGGYLPAYWGRLDHAWHARADCRRDCAHVPSSYLRRIWLDTLVFDRDQLAHLVAAHGADRLCMGSDWPFDMGEPDPVGFHAGLDDADRARVLGSNALAFLGLAQPSQSD
jgi:aminocarboxymuconate-semialdehyde decarboxylase